MDIVSQRAPLNILHHHIGDGLWFVGRAFTDRRLLLILL